MRFSKPSVLYCVIIAISLKEFLGLFIESSDPNICLYIDGVILNGILLAKTKNLC